MWSFDKTLIFNCRFLSNFDFLNQWSGIIWNIYWNEESAPFVEGTSGIFFERFSKRVGPKTTNVCSIIYSKGVKIIIKYLSLLLNIWKCPFQKCEKKKKIQWMLLYSIGEIEKKQNRVLISKNGRVVYFIIDILSKLLISKLKSLISNLKKIVLWKEDRNW